MQLLVKDLKLTEKINEDWIKQNCYIAGGACVSNFTRKPIHDVDLYFKTKEARDLFIDEIGDDKYINKSDNVWKTLVMYDALLKSSAIEIGDDKKFDDLGVVINSQKHEETVIYFVDVGSECLEIPEPLFQKQKWMFKNGYDYVIAERNHFEVEYSNTFLGNKSITIKNDGMIYQFILRFYGEPREVMDNTFDFQHCKIAYDLATNDYIASTETWKCLSKREIKYVNSFYPISSLKRLYKYAARDFTYKTDEFVKIIKDIHKVDVENKFVIEDQLIGYYEDFDYNATFRNEKW